MSLGAYFQSKSIWFIFISSLLLGIYYLLGYSISRDQHLALGLSVAVLFIGYFLLIKYEFQMSHLIGLGLLSRIVLLWVTPSLSQDFYRFLWDGHLIVEGINPYLWTPTEILSFGSLNPETIKTLWDGMGTLSQNNYSNYPPMHQFPAVISELTAGLSTSSNIMILRCILIGADIGVLMIGQKLMKQFNLPVKYILIYFLNPLVIIELCGNLHHEGLMIFGFTLSLYFLLKQEKIRAGVFMGVSVLTKLIPLLLLPLLLPKFGLKKNYHFYIATALVVILGFIPFYNNQFTPNYTYTLGLWFSNFEFNASIFSISKYLLKDFFELRLMSYMHYIVPGIIGFNIVFFLFKKETNLSKILTQMMFLLTGYFMISTTIHPWYIVTLVFLSCFTKYRFPIWWSFTIFFSYFSYHNNSVVESYIWKLIQYGIVIGIWGYEFYKFNRITTSSTD